MYPSHYLSAKIILDGYNGDMPFSNFLKKYFRENKKHGSKDRRSIASLCYYFFRIGKAVKQLPTEDRILLAEKFFTKSDTPKNEPSLDKIFPYADELSPGIEREDFIHSFFQQPLFFLRLRPGHEGKVRSKLTAAGIAFTEIDSTCLALESNSSINNILLIDKEVQVQDLNSQRTGEFIKVAAANVEIGKVWDCCAASGGKSMMAMDILEKPELTVSDKRSSILENLSNRFYVAGIKNYHSLVTDLEKKPVDDYQEKFDLVIADVPCTGSGTWARTPEQLYYFSKDRIGEYSSLQRSIIKNALLSLKQGGLLLYITCSVFKKENEDNVNFFLENYPLKLVKMDLLPGYQDRADSLFAALLQS